MMHYVYGPASRATDRVVTGLSLRRETPSGVVPVIIVLAITIIVFEGLE